VTILHIKSHNILIIICYIHTCISLFQESRMLYSITNEVLWRAGKHMNQPGIWEDMQVSGVRKLIISLSTRQSKHQTDICGIGIPVWSSREWQSSTTVKDNPMHNSPAVKKSDAQNAQVTDYGMWLRPKYMTLKLTKKASTVVLIPLYISFAFRYFKLSHLVCL